MAMFWSMVALKATLTPAESKRGRCSVQQSSVFTKDFCLNLLSITVSVFTCECLYSAAQCAHIIPQIFNPHEGILFYLVHIIGCTAAATLAFESTIAVPLVTGQRSLPLDWNRMEEDKRGDRRLCERQVHGGQLSV